jgi:hypothetical protein
MLNAETQHTLISSICQGPKTWEGRVAQILIIEMNLGAPRAGFARGVFDFGFGGNLNWVNLHQT